MINANELRIGNIYNRKHGKGWTPTIITEEIMGKIFSDSNEYALNDFEPIPLTAEILMQYEWIKNQQFYDHIEWSFLYPPEGIVSLQQDGQPEKVYNAALNPFIFKWDGWLSGTRKEITYLHQLQNLFKCLTGEELTPRING